MKRVSILAATLTPLLLAASCGHAANGDSAGEIAVSTKEPIASKVLGRFDQPWAAAFAPGTTTLFITEKPGTMKFLDTATGKIGTVTGLPKVDYGGQGGLGDVAFLPAETSSALGKRTIYLTWAEAGQGDTRGAALGKGTLVCEQADACRIDGLSVIWRQEPKVTGRGHYSHRIAVSPDGKYLFVSSGERQKGDPAQDPQSDLGKIVRLNLDGTPAAGNPLADENVARPEIWSMGHRNVLGLQFDAQGRLWGLEHGPAGGDELNLVEGGRNYGWPIVSNGDGYDGTPIPRHSTHPEFAAPAISWNPVIAPGDFVFYSGRLFKDWQGEAIVAGLKTQALIRVAIEGTTAKEVGRIGMERRIREIVEGPDGALFVLEDGKDGRLLELRPR